MFVKLTRRGPNEYVQLVEAYRDDAGRPKQHTVASLGRLDQINTELNSVISGLLRVTGQSPVAQPLTPTVSFEAARDFGDVWTLTELWNSLGFDRLRQVFRRTHHAFDVEALIRIMVLNRLCDPDSKFGVLRWLQTVTLPGVTLPGGGVLEFILAVPGRRYGDFVELLEPIHSQLCANAKGEVLGETTWSKLRLIVAHDPLVAKEATVKRDTRIAELQKKAQQWSGKLDDQDTGKKARGRKLSDGGARARFYREVSEAHLSRIVKVDLKSELFTYDIDDRALTHARLMDGKLLLVTNTPDLTPDEVVKRYKSLADIERGFRGLKSESEIGPVYHRLPARIRAHAAICFMALILYRVMRMRLRSSATALSPERALDKLRRIQHHQVVLNDTQPVAGLSTINQEHTAILAALTIKKPSLNTQLNLL